MKGRIESMAYTMDGQLFLSLTVPRAHAEELRKLQGVALDIDIKRQRNKRSMNANALAWVICDELGQALGMSKEAVYKKAIKEIGVFDVVRARNGAVASLMERWGRQGIGWVAEDMGESDARGYHDVFVYYGSSVYNAQEMSRLLDYLTDDARQMGITLRATPEQVAEAKRRWGADA